MEKLSGDFLHGECQKNILTTYGLKILRFIPTEQDLRIREIPWIKPWHPKPGYAAREAKDLREDVPRGVKKL